MIWFWKTKMESFNVRINLWNYDGDNCICKNFKCVYYYVSCLVVHFLIIHDFFVKWCLDVKRIFFSLFNHLTIHSFIFQLIVYVIIANLVLGFQLRPKHESKCGLWKNHRIQTHKCGRMKPCSQVIFPLWELEPQ
jgi:hypothetical protein